VVVIKLARLCEEIAADLRHISMDTITHGIAGALVGKAFCGGGDMFSAKPWTAPASSPGR
jgi:hypothetical protein